MPYAVLIAAGLLLVVLSWMRPQYSAFCGAILLLCAVLLAGLRGNSEDYLQYVGMFDTMAASSLPFPLRLYVGKDPWFGGLILIIQSLGLGVQSLFLVSSALALSLKAKAFTRIFGSYVTPLFVTLCTTYFVHEYTQIRLAIALGFSFLGLVALCEGNRRLWAVYTVLAVGFHVSTIAVVICELPFLFGCESIFSLSLYGIGGLMALSLTTNVLGFATDIIVRIATYESTSVTSHAVAFIILRAAVVSLLAFMVIREEQEPCRLRLWKMCCFMEVMGVAVFLIFLGRAPGLGFRVQELLDAFAVFIIAAAFLWRGWVPWGVALSFCTGLVVLLTKGAVLVPYQLSSRALW